jgi:hypothetical protein
MMDGDVGMNKDSTQDWLTPEDLDWDLDYGNCPYYDRYYNLPRADPFAICGYGCREEPACITDEPSDGWPSQREPSNWIRTA